MALNNQYRKWGPLIIVPLALTIGWLYAKSANRIIPMTEQEAASIAPEAYFYGYSLATTKITGLAFTNTKQHYFYPNPLDRLTVSPRNGFKYNADGALDLYFLLLARATRRRRGGKLAAGSGGRFYPVHAAILAEDNPTLDPAAQQSIVGSSAG